MPIRWIGNLHMGNIRGTFLQPFRHIAMYFLAVINIKLQTQAVGLKSTENIQRHIERAQEVTRDIIRIDRFNQESKI